MRSDYIVPEAPGRRRGPLGPKLLTSGAVLGLAFVLAGQWGGDSLESASEAEEIRLVNADQAAGEDQPDPGHSFLDSITPISKASARAAPPEGDMPLPALPALDDLPQAASLPPPSSEPMESEPAAPALRSLKVTVRSGDSLSGLFERHGLRAADWISLSRLGGEARRLRSLRPGDELALSLDDAGELQALELALDEMRTLHLRRQTEGRFAQSVSEAAVDIRTVAAEGTIENSLFLAAKAAGLSDRLTMELTDIFAWDIDFVLDIRSGDRFRLVYEEIYRDGEKLKDGNILAAEFINRGQSTRAVRYDDSDGLSAYYSPEGLPMKKAFLRSPVDFTRISSRFSLGRKHPILNKIRAHRGVDYAAPSGTPVKSAGNGKVIFAGVKGGYGNVVIVQHAGKYKTLYAHLKNFRRGIRRGVTVAQGQTVGYVGMSGLATGPHLHYEFLINDSHVNPLTVKLPSAPRIAESELARFQSQTAKLLALLPKDSPTEVADAR